MIILHKKQGYLCVKKIYVMVKRHIENLGKS